MPHKPNPNAKVRLRNDPVTGAMRWGTKEERAAEEAAAKNDSASNSSAAASTPPPPSSPATSSSATKRGRGWGGFFEDVETL